MKHSQHSPFARPSVLVPLALLAALGAACSSPRTQIMVVSDTDLAVPGQIDAIDFEVTGPEGQMEVATADPTTGLPAYLGVAHEGGPLGPVTVRVVGRLGAAVVVERTARVDFLPERTVVLQMNLHASCISRTCGAGQTCADGACRPIAVDPAELTDWTGTPPGLDSGTPPRDSGMDSGTDGAVDSGTDTGVDSCVPIAELCNELDDDCDTLIDEDFDLTSELMNCGTCGTVCTTANGTPECVAGACEIMSCDGTFMSCDLDVMTGCEADTDTDVAHCGGCDMPCTAGQSCTGGTCACTPPFEMGATGCVDTTRDPNNCGAVGTVCADREYCVGSACACRPGLISDGAGGCVDTDIDPAHCGSVGNACTGGDVCRGGTCRPSCPGSMDLCGDSCTDVTTDVTNCGACGTVCATSEVCANSMCRPFTPGLGCTTCPCTTCPGATGCCTYPSTSDIVCVDGPCP